MKKKLNKEVKDLISSQIEIEGFDYAMVDKISPEDWTPGSLPDDIAQAWIKYLHFRNLFRNTLKEYGIDTY